MKSCKILIEALLLAQMVSLAASLPEKVNIGLLLQKNQDVHKAVFQATINMVNSKAVLGKDSNLNGVVREINLEDSWDAEKKTCELLSSGVVAVIGPTDSQASLHVGSICDSYEIPHINIVPKSVIFNSATGVGITVGSAHINAVPSPSTSVVGVDLTISRSVLVQAYMDLLRALGWTKFVYMYERDEHLFEFQKHFNGKSLKSGNLNVKVRQFDLSKPFRKAFWSLKKTKIREILLDVQCSELKTVLKHAQQVSMMTEEHSYLVVCLDAQTLDLDDFKHSRARIVWFNAIDLKNQVIPIMREAIVGEVGERLDTKAALIHDAVLTAAYGLNGVDRSQNIDMTEAISCRGQKQWQHGSTMANYIRSSGSLDGLTGKIRYDNLGQRTGYMLNVARLTENGPKVVGNWTESANSTVSVERSELMFLQKGDPTLHEDERETLIVTALKNDPFFMNRQTSKVAIGNDRFEGYAVDLIEELSRIVGFDYTLKEVDDKKYGRYDKELKRWNGMIYEVMEGKADLATGDLSITSDREDVVDFTLPFMSTGISILFKKPTTKELELFSFLSPFEGNVWVYVCGAYIGVSTLLFMVARVSPYEWTDPHPCRINDKILRNQFSCSNSFWFTMAAVMQQGSDLAPRSLSTRLVAAIWYFFTLIMISSYTANLAAFLTVEKVVYPIEKAEDLYNHPQNIKYGCLESGSTDTFFSKSKNETVFKKMYPKMLHEKSNIAGVKNVEKGNYVFFMESAAIEYTIERNCNLTQIGGLLDSKGYGIAFAKNSTRKKDYRTKMSEAILSLQESGTLEILKNRWWKEKRGGGACDIDDSQGGEGVKELTLANVGGVFVVLGMGITMSFILCFLEVYVKSCKLASSKCTSKWTQIKRLIKFALSLRENY